MPVRIRRPDEIRKMKRAGRMLRAVHEAMEAVIRPGVSTAEIDAVGEDLIYSLGAIPNFKFLDGFPSAICVSVNDVIVHGIPSSEVFLKEGDIVSIDAGLSFDGWHSDAARTYGVGNITPEARRLIMGARSCFYAGLEFTRKGCHLYDISAAIGLKAEELGFSVVSGLTGHGIGRHLHEEPMVPNVAQKGRGILLCPGMTLAIEPMLAARGEEIRTLPDGWGVATADGSLAAHYENTILITEGDPVILTGE